MGLRNAVMGLTLLVTGAGAANAKPPEVEKDFSGNTCHWSQALMQGNLHESLRHDVGMNVWREVEHGGTVHRQVACPVSEARLPEYRATLSQRAVSGTGVQDPDGPRTDQALVQKVLHEQDGVKILSVTNTEPALITDTNVTNLRKEVGPPLDKANAIEKREKDGSGIDGTEEVEFEATLKKLQELRAKVVAYKEAAEKNPALVNIRFVHPNHTLTADGKGMIPAAQMVQTDTVQVNAQKALNKLIACIDAEIAELEGLTPATPPEVVEEKERGAKLILSVTGMLGGEISPDPRFWIPAEGNQKSGTLARGNFGGGLYVPYELGDNVTLGPAVELTVGDRPVGDDGRPDTNFDLSAGARLEAGNENGGFYIEVRGGAELRIGSFSIPNGDGGTREIGSGEMAPIGMQEVGGYFFFARNVRGRIGVVFEETEPAGHVNEGETQVFVGAKVSVDFLLGNSSSEK